MLWIMPFLGLYLMLMLLMPVPEAPYGWQFVRNIYAHLKESFLEISQNLSGGGREDYDLSLSGFTEDGELAGALGRRDREIMTIESSAPLATNVYLTGKVYDTFDGRRWLQSREDTEKERYADTARTLCALAKYEEDYQQDYLLRARIKISYRYFHTSFLFAPLKLWELQQKGDKMSFREQDGSFLLDKPGGYGTEYEAVFYQMNGGQEAFYHFLQEGRQTSDEKLPEKILKDLRGVTGQEIRAEDLAYQRQRVYDTCLKETALSENVRDALLEMTQGAETDVERLRAIEASLASLNYTRSPGELPDVISNESEFLDYFLLESRQGYCNYFATAFVLLARAQGIPARYVQGFCVPMKGNLATNVYLTGKVYDTFDGRRWLQSREDTEKERYADTARTLCALAKYEEDYQQDYLLRARIKISYRYFHTSFLFAPLKLWELQQKGDKMSFREQDGSFLLDKPGGYGTEYEAVFYQMNGGQEAFYHFLQEGRQTSDEKLPEKILKDLRGVTGQEIRAEDLAYQRQRVYDTCLKETALSENVRDALLEMTQGAETDVERLRAIEASLASLNYTRSPGELPDVISNESEFLDYFLLESRQGYCNYFATAFVLLARAQGIPARYVQGFCVPMKGKKEAVVYSYMAHAWPEAYLDGIGWIPFEPTPGFAGSRYTPWGLKSDKAEVYKESDFQNKWQSKAGQEDGMIPQETVAEDSVSGRGNSGARRFFGIAGLSFLAVFLMGILVLASDYLLHRYRYQKMNNEQKLNEDIRKTFKMLARTGIKRENGETLEEFAERCEDLLDTKGILCFIGNYEGYLYGNKEIIPENIEEVKKKQNEIMELLWKRNKLDYFKAKFL